MSYDDIKIDNNFLLDMLKDFCKPTKETLINEYINGNITKSQLDEEMKRFKG